MSLITNTLLAFESAPLPDSVRRAAIRLLVSGARRHAASGSPETDAAFAEQMALRPIAEHTDAANEQHYEVPAAFFEACLGPRLKYSSCLYAPGECLGEKAPGTAFLQPDSVVFDAPKSGYILRFHPGVAAADPYAVSPSSLQGFAVTASPATPQGGVRNFCTDARGDVCEMAAPVPTLEKGYCPETCKVLR